MPDFEQTVWEITTGAPNTDDLWELAQVNVKDSMEVAFFVNHTRKVQEMQ